MASEETYRLNQFARRHGYDNYYKYQVVRKILSGSMTKEEVSQQKFENEVGQLSCVSLGEIGMVRDFVPGVDLGKAIRTLEGMHHLEKGRHRPGKVYADVLRDVYYKGKTSNEIGKRLDISGARVRQLRDEGLEYLRHILDGENFR